MRNLPTVLPSGYNIKMKVGGYSKTLVQFVPCYKVTHPTGQHVLSECESVPVQGIQPYGDVEASFHWFITLVLDRDERSVLHPDCFTPQGYIAQYPMNIWLGGSHSWSGCFGDQKNFLPARNQTMIPQRTSPYPGHYTSWAIQALLLLLPQH